jgi:hypothetical protein
LHGGIVLTMAPKAPVILAAAKVLDVELRGRMIDNVPNHLGSRDRGFADLEVVDSLI